MLGNSHAQFLGGEKPERAYLFDIGHHQYKEKLSGELNLNKSFVTLPSFLKLKVQEGASLNGGKIVDKAKVFGNAKNTLNSMRLNNANQ